VCRINDFELIEFSGMDWQDISLNVAFPDKSHSLFYVDQFSCTPHAIVNDTFYSGLKKKKRRKNM